MGRRDSAEGVLQLFVFRDVVENGLVGSKECGDKDCKWRHAASVYAVEPLTRPSATLSPRSRERDTGIKCCLFHRLRKQVVHGRPCAPDVGREGVSQSVLERPLQRIAEG